MDWRAPGATDLFRSARAQHGLVGHLLWSPPARRCLRRNCAALACHPVQYRDLSMVDAGGGPSAGAVLDVGLVRKLLKLRDLAAQPPVETATRQLLSCR